jgi:hypothetical protein
MTFLTQIRLARRLFPHLKELEPEEVLLWDNALTAWIGIQHMPTIMTEPCETELAQPSTER